MSNCVLPPLLCMEEAMAMVLILWKSRLELMVSFILLHKYRDVGPSRFGSTTKKFVNFLVTVGHGIGYHSHFSGVARQFRPPSILHRFIDEPESWMYRKSEADVTCAAHLSAIFEPLAATTNPATSLWARPGYGTDWCVHTMESRLMSSSCGECVVVGVHSFSWDSVRLFCLGRSVHLLCTMRSHYRQNQSFDVAEYAFRTNELKID